LHRGACTCNSGRCSLDFKKTDGFTATEIKRNALVSKMSILYKNRTMARSLKTAIRMGDYEEKANNIGLHFHIWYTLTNLNKH